MAKCPECSEIISLYEFFLNSRWSGIRCSNCHSSLFIRDKDFYNWYLTAFIILFAGGLFLVRATNILPALLSIIITLMSLCLFFTVGWHFSKLEKIRK